MDRYRAYGSGKISRRIAIAWAIPAFAGALMIGIIGMALYGNGYFEDVERIMPHMANELLPAWLAGVFISGAIAVSAVYIFRLIRSSRFTNPEQ